jgi:hypothetical protein
MGKLSRMAVAARKRHRTRRGEIDPEEAAELKQDGTYDPGTSCSHDTSESDAESANSASSALRRVGTSVKNFFVGKSRSVSPSPTLDTDLQPDWEIEEVSRVASTRLWATGSLTTDFTEEG